MAQAYIGTLKYWEIHDSERQNADALHPHGMADSWEGAELSGIFLLLGHVQVGLPALTRELAPARIGLQ